MGIFEILFPKYCIQCKKIGSYICSSCFAQLSFDVPEKCLVCGKPAIGGITHPTCNTKYSIDGSSSALVYKGLARRLLYQFKYSPYLSDLRIVLGNLFYEALIQKETFHTFLKIKPVLIPIPLSHQKLRGRGYNQAEILAQELAKRLKIPIVPLLARSKVTQSQYGLTKEERKRNIHNAFHIQVSLQGQSVVLVDDILTTGATFVEATKVLKKNGIKKVWGVALARD